MPIGRITRSKSPWSATECTGGKNTANINITAAEVKNITSYTEKYLENFCVFTFFHSLPILYNNNWSFAI